MSDNPGGMIGPTNHGVQELIDRDPSATWNGTTVTGPYGLGSPRVVVIGMYNPEEYWAEKQNGNGDTFTIINLIAMFIQSVNQGEVTGVMVGKRGDFMEGAGPPAAGAGFLQAIHMVR